MSVLAWPDRLHLEAAQGWLALGNWQEASVELEQIPSELRAQPEVLEVSWHIYAAAKKWGSALLIASVLTRIRPGYPLYWIHRSDCLHALKRTTAARDNLLWMVKEFPRSASMRYNLACYECQLGRLEQAKHWLEQAFKLGDAKAMMQVALEDPNLEPLWKNINRG